MSHRPPRHRALGPIRLAKRSHVASWQQGRLGDVVQVVDGVGEPKRGEPGNGASHWKGAVQGVGTRQSAGAPGGPRISRGSSPFLP